MAPLAGPASECCLHVIALAVASRSAVSHVGATLSSLSDQDSRSAIKSYAVPLTPFSVLLPQWTGVCLSLSE